MAAAKTASYLVTDKLLHDGKLLRRGATVELGADEAKPLLISGAIKPKTPATVATT